MMKNFVFLLFLLGISIFSDATEIPNGAVQGNWTKNNSPYNINGNIFIQQGQSLTIEAGTILNFTGNFKFSVYGKLTAQGNENQKIIFSSQTTWKGLTFYDLMGTSDTSKLVYCVFSNTFAQGSYPDDCGGAIGVMFYSQILLAQSSFNNCKASTNGGILCFLNCTYPSIIENCSFSNSESQNGGAVFCESSSPVFRNCDFSKGKSNNGGAIFATINSLPVFENCTFSQNQATENGGAIFCSENSILQIVNCKISNNAAQNNGGAMFFQNSLKKSAEFKIVNSLIVNNIAKNGGGIYGENIPAAKIYNSNICHNKAKRFGGGIYCSKYFSPIFKNSILTGNLADTSGGQVFLGNNNSDPYFSFCNIQGNHREFGVDSSLGINVYNISCYVSNLDTLSMFAKPSQTADTSSNGMLADWRLQVLSPCINAGISDTTGLNIPKNDLAGNLRIFDTSIIDLGPYEFVNFSPTDISLSQLNIDECNKKDTFLSFIRFSDPNPGDTMTFSLVKGEGSTDNDSFFIENNELHIAKILDFETKTNYSVRIKATDFYGVSFEKYFSISVNNVNEKPLKTFPSKIIVDECIATDSALLYFSTLDVDEHDSFVYTFVHDTAGIDNKSFRIDENKFYSVNILDFETKTSYKLHIRSIDAGGLTKDTSFILTIQNVNEKPTIAYQLSDKYFFKDTYFSFVIEPNPFSDPDKDDILTFRASSPNNTPIPSWLKFDPQSLTFSGKSSLEAPFLIKLSATDQGGFSISDTFKLVITTDTSQIGVSRNENSFSLSPNPAFEGRFSVQSSETQDFEIKIFDIHGREIFRNFTKRNSLIDISQFPSGIYLVKIFTKNQTFSYRLIR